MGASPDAKRSVSVLVHALCVSERYLVQEGCKI